MVIFGDKICEVRVGKMKAPFHFNAFCKVLISIMSNLSFSIICALSFICLVSGNRQIKFGNKATKLKGRKK